MKKMLTFCLIMTIVLSLFGCAKKTKTEQNAEDVSIDAVLPQTAYFKAVRKQLTGIEWNAYILKDTVTYDKSEGKVVWAYKMGCLLTNSGFASAIKEESSVKKLSDDMLHLAQQSDIVDEDVVSKIMDIITSLEALTKEENYKEISNKIKEIESTLKKYYIKSSDESLMRIIKFSSWLEAFYIVSSAIKDNYRADLLNLYNRNQEIKYFKDLLKNQTLTFNEMEFLTTLGETISNKEALNEDAVKKIHENIVILRSAYMK